MVLVKEGVLVKRAVAKRPLAPTTTLAPRGLSPKRVLVQRAAALMGFCSMIGTPNMAPAPREL